MMSTFPLSHIALTALIASVATLLLLWIGRRWFKMEALHEMIALAIVVGFSVLAWRAAGNTGALNNDPIPVVSPNDVLCPLVTYLFIGMYAAFRHPIDALRWEQVRVLLALISF